MEKRLTNLLRTMLRYNGEELVIVDNHIDLSISVKINGDKHKVGILPGDRNLISYILSLVGISDYKETIKKGNFDINIDGEAVNFRVLVTSENKVTAMIVKVA